MLLEALRAFAELVGPGKASASSTPSISRGGDLPALLATWLDELLFLADVERVVADDADIRVSQARA